MGLPWLPTDRARLNDHTRTVFDADLQELKLLVRELAGASRRAMEQTILVLKAEEQSRLTTPSLADHVLHSALRAIEDKAVAIIAMRQPLAIDLREIISTTRIANDLRHIGGIAIDVSARGRTTALRPSETLRLGQCQMAEAVSNQTNIAYQSYEDGDVKQAIEIWHDDKHIDQMTNRLSNKTIALMASDSANIAIGMQALFCIKDLERAGDHATNIAEAVCYLATGSIPPGERPKTSTTLTIALGACREAQD